MARRNLAARRAAESTAAEPSANDGGSRQSLIKISENVIETVTSMTQASQAIDNIGSQSTQLADYSSTIASAGEELSATINSISQNVESTIDAAAEAKRYAAAGTSVIDNTVEQIRAVDGVLEQATEALRELLGVAEQADTIIRVVNDISAKTDLLALNASIEAARAGSAGRGFAVVAHEVGRLSEKTQASISEIEGIITSITKNVEAVSRSIQSGSDSARSAVTDVTSAKSAIDDIVRRIDRVDNDVANIGAAIKEQGVAVSDIAENISTISRSSSTVKEDVERVSGRIDAVTRRSNATRNVLAGFDLGARALMQQCKVDHMFWMYRLRRMVDGRETIQEEEFVDHTKCRLGRWYQAQDPQQMTNEQRTLFIGLDSPHARLHRLAAEAIRAYNTGRADEAVSTYQSTLDVSSEIVDLLERLAGHARD